MNFKIRNIPIAIQQTRGQYRNYGDLCLGFKVRNCWHVLENGVLSRDNI
ncbi:Uncharacterized protein APZ42_008840 [Daphnia magna]|uniref:Uncharacterized protein n=1 Tax=Daphnia magna TaxID=35525 RepID=A0A164EDT2_9CRUS|nr:Uncharacterized protein APZ42_008840 [Daphnia magna]